MCGRFTLFIDEDFYPRFRISEIIPITPNYNISPGQNSFVVIKDKEQNKLIKMRWGLIPHWAKDEKIGYKMINARAETVTNKPSFKKAYKTQRCIIPANGFFEWEKRNEKKIPHYFQLKEEKYLGLAGLYENWQNPQEKKIQTFTIITTTANTLVSRIHNRMPVILDKKEEDNWLRNDDSKFLKDLLNPVNDSYLKEYEVSTEVNNPRNNHKNLIIPIQK